MLVIMDCLRKFFSSLLYIPLHFMNTRSSSIASPRRARWGRIKSPLWLKTLSTGAEVAGMLNVFSIRGERISNFLFSVKIVHTLVVLVEAGVQIVSRYSTTVEFNDTIKGETVRTKDSLRENYGDRFYKRTRLSLQDSFQKVKKWPRDRDRDNRFRDRDIKKPISRRLETETESETIQLC